MKQSLCVAILFALLLTSCTSKKDILYFQDAAKFQSNPVVNVGVMVQPNDILSIMVSAKIPETAIPYNNTIGATNATPTIDVLKLQGYLVTPESTIVFPVLGTVSVLHKTTSEIETALKKQLESGGHLIGPIVSVRILNAKVTILGEVNRPGTYSFSEQYMTLPQALGYAGDLTITGKRKDILLIREADGVRTITHLDLTTADWMNDPKYIIKQNDVIVVNPSNPKIKSAGFIGNTSVVLTIASLLLSTFIIIRR
jgi:polysaccharide export outer membrane protein